MTIAPTRNLPGTPDLDFGEEGVVTFPIEGKLDVGIIYAVASTADQKLLITARATDLTKPHKLARLNDDGSLDESFGTNGSVDLPIDPASDLAPRRLYVEDDGSLLITGTSDLQMMVMKLDANGVPVQGFGPQGDGTAIFDIYDLITSVAANNSRFKNPRFMKGRHDEQGRQPADAGDAGDVGAVGFAAQDGRIFLVTTVFFEFNYLSGIVLCLTKDGLLDTSFNGTGSKLVELPGIDGPWNYAAGIAVQPDGKILVCGDFSTGDEDRLPDAYIIRYLADGEIDPSYGQGTNKTGVVILTDPDHWLDLVSIKIKPDGGAFAVGVADRASQGRQGLLVSLNRGGNFNHMFNSGRPVYSQVPPQGVSWTRCAIQEDGKFVVGGQGGSGLLGDNSSTVVARYLVGGSLDLTFNEVGWVERNVPTGIDIIRDMILTPEERVVVTGYVPFSSTPVPGFVLRYLGGSVSTS